MRLTVGYSRPIPRSRPLSASAEAIMPSLHEREHVVADKTFGIAQLYLCVIYK